MKQQVFVVFKDRPADKARMIGMAATVNSAKTFLPKFEPWENGSIELYEATHGTRETVYFIQGGKLLDPDDVDSMAGTSFE